MAMAAVDRQRPGVRAVLAIGFLLWLAAFVALFLHHAMWRDELQAWQIATASGTPLDLYWNTRHEGHPPLWHLLLWLGAQVSSDPAVMRTVQAAIAAAIFALVALRAPFTRLEKLLLLSSYFLLFQYTVIARCYGLGVLLLFLAVQAQAARSRLAGLWLGLAANTSLLATLASFALAGGLALDRAQPGRRRSLSLAIYGVLLLVALAWAFPDPDRSTNRGWFTQPDLDRFVDAWDALVTAFAPLEWPVWRFWQPELHRFVTGLTGASKGVTVLPLAPVFFLIALVGIGERRAQLVFTVAVTLLGTLFYVKMNGATRHHGTHFIVFVACLWLARLRAPRVADRPMARAAAIFLLSLNALGGVLALSGALQRPYSMAESAAGYIRAAYPEDVFIAGYRDTPVSAVGGYLGRPIYYPQCDCLASFIRKPLDRVNSLPVDPGSPLWSRLLARLAAEGRTDGVLVLNVEADIDAVEAARPGFTLTLRRAFTDAALPDERYYLYDIRFDRGAAAP